MTDTPGCHISLYTTAFDEKRISNYIITKHISSNNVSNISELCHTIKTKININECSFTDICSGLKAYSLVNPMSQSTYVEAISQYFRGEWQQANATLEKILKYIKDLTPAIILRKRMQGENDSCPDDWVNHIEIKIN